MFFGTSKCMNSGRKCAASQTISFGMTPIAQDVLRMIDVVQKQIERGDALHEPALDQFPFLRRNDSRDQIERENPFRALVVVVNRKGDALLKKVDAASARLRSNSSRSISLKRSSNLP